MPPTTPNGFAPYELRRAYSGGAGIEQIKLSYCHASLTTTERFLEDAPCDHPGLSLTGGAQNREFHLTYIDQQLSI